MYIALSQNRNDHTITMVPQSVKLEMDLLAYLLGTLMANAQTPVVTTTGELLLARTTFPPGVCIAHKIPKICMDIMSMNVRLRRKGATTTASGANTPDQHISSFITNLTLMTWRHSWSWDSGRNPVQWCVPAHENTDHHVKPVTNLIDATSGQHQA